MAQDEPDRILSAIEVAAWLRERIRTGRAVQGQRLIEADIIRDTGATRSRVREALQRLESEGLVVIEEFRGASVRRFTLDEIRQIYRTRMALEGMAAHDFAVADDPARKSQLADLQEKLNAVEHTGDHPAFVRANDAWHALILDGADNEYIRGFVDRLRLPLYRLLFTAFYQPHRIDDANADHRLITEAIVRGNGDEAERLMRQHIEDALNAVMEMGDQLPH
ncbi:GntR family transcriptional regulator [Sphingomonas sp. LT1P40]|uniref:GntR family transcriptional regulator n=1 Tax=Alteristakelama amylovorans TaxID=3096166 RepID=UPI002FCAB532